MRKLSPISAPSRERGLAPGYSGAILTFNSACVTCNRWIAFLAKRTSPSALVFSALTSEIGSEIRRAVPHASFALVEKGQIYEDSSAIVRVLAKCRWPWRSAAIFLWIPPLAREAALRAILKLLPKPTPSGLPCGPTPLILQGRIFHRRIGGQDDSPTESMLPHVSIRPVVVDVVRAAHIQKQPK